MPDMYSPKELSSKMLTRMTDFKNQLIDAGFKHSDPYRWSWNFSKSTVNNVYFIVNLLGLENCIHIEYGFAINENFIIKQSILSEINANTDNVYLLISEYYKKYCNCDENNLIKAKNIEIKLKEAEKQEQLKPNETIVNIMGSWRKKLLQFGFKHSEASYWHWHFYKQTNDFVAFAINLYGSKSGLEITYGYSSTAFTKIKSNKDSFSIFGIENTDINLRDKIIYQSNEDFINDTINSFYQKYINIEKDELLNIVKEKRKAFFNIISAKLKPLGFKKKGNNWNYLLENGFPLCFEAQKSSYSDEYYFNIYISNLYRTRKSPDNNFPSDWQAISKKQLDIFLDKEALPVLEEIINTPIAELENKIENMKSAE